LAMTGEIVVTAIVRSRGATTSFVNLVSVFFFQAEDGIRDRNVTGVQTCALPIYIATEDIQEFLKELTRVLQKKHIGQQEFLVWTKRIDRLREEVEKDERETDNVARNV